mmetsp:Transcript_102634/g.294062  ORF Transcript_102634/g.294062 Transcript_102634/m.294062 type:complete len:206 (+) Transcript_102634:328-945(+)
MFRLVVASLALVGASAFMGAPVGHRAAVKSSMSMSYEAELGAQKPLGFWDPIGLVENVDQERFDRLRSVELKHGRVSMLAVLGHIVTSNGIRLPGMISNSKELAFADVPTGLAAFSKLPAAGFWQIVLFCGALEILVMRDVTGLGEFPGDFRNGFIDFGWDKFSPEQKLQKRAIELNNGRAAQMGILALMMHECVDGKPYIFFDL